MAKSTTRKPLPTPAKGAAAAPGSGETKGTASRFSDAERAAMQERARELKAEARAGKDKAAGERAVLSAIAAMPEPDRTLGQRIHELVLASAPTLCPRLWYGMPAYAHASTPAGDGKVVCFFQAASKFKTRYASFAFTDAARLDEGAGGMWPVGFGLKVLSAADEARIIALVKKSMP